MFTKLVIVVVVFTVALGFVNVRFSLVVDSGTIVAGSEVPF